MVHGIRKEAPMIPDGFRLPNTQFAKISPKLPTDTRGKPRADDWRTISGIVHAIEAIGGALGLHKIAIEKHVLDLEGAACTIVSGLFVKA